MDPMGNDLYRNWRKKHSIFFLTGIPKCFRTKNDNHQIEFRGNETRFLVITLNNLDLLKVVGKMKNIHQMVV